jgi:hypothetical protein
MLPNWNEYTYAKQFEGNLRGSSEPVPMRVNTNLRMMTEAATREFPKQDLRLNRIPIYIFERRENLPLHPSLQARGRHYFTW